MLTALIAAQLFGIQNETTKINSNLKYGSNSRPGQDEAAAFVFIMYAIIGSFIWPAPLLVSQWRKGHKTLSIFLGFAIFVLAIGMLPFYLLFGFCWSVIRFAMRNDLSK